MRQVRRGSRCLSHPLTGGARGRLIGLGAIAAALAGLCGPAPQVIATGDAPSISLFRTASTLDGDDAAQRVRLDGDAIAAARAARGEFRVTDVPLAGGPVDLALERFTVTSGKTLFVRGNAGGADELLDFDPDRVLLLRGRVIDHPGSHVFLAIGATVRAGSIDLGSGREQFRIAPAGGDPDELTIFRPGAAMSLPPGMTLCGLEASDGSNASGGPPMLEGSADPMVGRRQIDLAIETDYEYFTLFPDMDAAGEYVVAMYAAVSDVFIRDVNTSVALTFVRLWDTPDDLFNEPDPLGAFRTHWENFMGNVPRDVAQFCSGRRDLPYGGVAWLNGLCNNFSYSVVGYVTGFFPDPSQPSPLHYDVHVTAHELGHNCGALHTHDYGIDTCNEFGGPALRGTIMSYCSQTRSGGNANTDMRFHVIPQNVMRSYITGRGCIIDDCNNNGVDDAVDILNQTSSDSNANGVPDECEDCNSNGNLDDADISLGISDDDNGNGIPDECEPDCNNNGTPDGLDLILGADVDENGNRVPDGCEADCDASGMSDYTQIQADMSLDVNRNIILDSCEDCDGDGTPDLVALGGAHNVWVASYAATSIGEFHATTGVRMTTGVAGQIRQGNDVVIALDGRILVSSGSDDRIVQFSLTGGYLGDFVAAGAGGLDNPGGLVFGPDNHLYVSSRNSNSVLRYDGQTGAFIDVFAAPFPSGLLSPFGLVFGPGGDLYVTSGDNRVLRFDGQTGAFIGDFVTVLDNGGLDTPRGLVFKTDGNLLVASYSTNQLLEFNGVTGAFLGQFNQGGTDTALTFDGPWGVRIGRDGHVYASRHLVTEDVHDDTGGPHLHINATRIFVFHGASGIFLRSYVTGDDTGLWQPTGFDFYPGHATDCNVNGIPDNCDIADGTSLDENGDGIPDECPVIGGCPADVFGGDGVVNIQDLLALLGAWGTADPQFDIVADGVIDIQDLLALLGAWGPCTTVSFGGPSAPITPSGGPQSHRDDLIRPQGG